jgi:hypothetical protein
MEKDALETAQSILGRENYFKINFKKCRNPRTSQV